MPTTGFSFATLRVFFSKLLDFTKRVTQHHESTASRDTDPYQSALQNMSPIIFPRPALASSAVAINRSWRGDRKFYSHLITNSKSHKPDGEVGVRNIRASSMTKR